MLNSRAFLVLLSILCSFLASAALAQEAELTGVWRGSFSINIGGDREYVLTISETDGALTAVLDIPAQNMLNLAADSIRIEGNNVRFLFPRIDGEYYGVIHSDRAHDGKPVRMDGDWSQAGEYIPITLRRTLTD